LNTVNTKILFMGTPYFAARALTGLLGSGFKVIGVVTQPDKGKGRGGKLALSEVKIEAERVNLPVYQPTTKAELTQIVNVVAPDLVVVAAYGMIIPQEALDIPKYGALNIHGSILPKYRGASPISEAILNGEPTTGITIIKMSAGMDEGDIVYRSAEYTLHADETTETLTNELASIGAETIVAAIPDWVSGEIKATPQDEKAATYCRKIAKEDGHIDWTHEAVQIERMVRAYTPWPTAYTFINEKRIKILRSRHCEEPCDAAISDVGFLNFKENHIYVGTGNGTLEIIELQPEGRKPMAARDFINGNKDLDGMKLA